MCPDYLEGLLWVLLYYFQGVLHRLGFDLLYVPFASDLVGCSILKCGDRNYFQFGMSFMHFQQECSAAVRLAREYEQDNISTGGQPAGRVAAPRCTSEKREGGPLRTAGGHVSRDTWLASKERGERSEDQVAPGAQPLQVAATPQKAVPGSLTHCEAEWLCVGDFVSVRRRRSGPRGLFFNPRGFEVSKSAQVAERQRSLGATGVRGEGSLGILTLRAGEKARRAEW